MTVGELIDALSKIPREVRVEAWDPVEDEFKNVSGAVWGVDGDVIYLQTLDVGDKP